MGDVRPEWYELRNALEQADVSSAEELLRSDPTLIDARNGIGETVLHFLAVENNQPAVEWIHGRGADLNATNEFGTPLLFEVAQLGYRDLFLWLIQQGADPDRKNAFGQSIEDCLAELGNSDMIEFIKAHAKPRI